MVIVYDNYAGGYRGVEQHLTDGYNFFFNGRYSRQNIDEAQQMLEEIKR